MSERFPTGYFVASTASRASTRHEGIVPHERIDAGELWLFSTQALARGIAQERVNSYSSTPDGTVDIWRVDLSGVDAEHYPHIVDGEDLFAGRRSMPPDRLQLFATL